MIDREPAFRAKEPPAEQLKNQFRRHRKKAAVLLLCAVFLAVLLGLFSVQIRQISVSGNRHYSEDQVRELIFTDRFMPRSALLTFLRTGLRPHREIPFVDGYRIRWKSPTSLEIIIYEKSVVGYVRYMGSNLYFDKDGIVSESTTEEIEGVPQITGLKYGHIVLHQVLPVEDQAIFGQILNLTQVLSTSQIMAERIDFDSLGNATLYIGSLTVRLGGNANMSGKLQELKDILTDYEQLSGTLYLDSYDPANSNPMYRFESN